MLRKIIASSVENPLLIGLLTISLVAWGSYAMFHTPVDAIPDLSDVQVIVFTEYPGQAPQVVEAGIDLDFHIAFEQGAPQ